MSDKTSDQSTFEKMYDRLKTVYGENGLTPPDDVKEQYDTSITFNLMKIFRDNAEYPMDRFSLSSGMERIADQLREDNDEWDPNSRSMITEFIDTYTPWGRKEPPTLEQAASDNNALNYLEGTRTKTDVLANVISATPSLNGISIQDAVSIAEADILNKGNAAETLNKFSGADPSLVRAVSYTMLYIENGKAHGQNEVTKEMSNQARSYMHYTSHENTEYVNWHADRRNEVITSIARDPELMEQIKQIKCPLNISTEEELLEQRNLRESIADNIVSKMSKTFGVDDVLTAEDSTVAHLSRLNMRVQNEGIGSMHSHQVGILNDETIVLGYNPAYHLAENDAFFMKTDQDETRFFIDTVIEETQHAIDNIYADKLVLGTLTPDAPIRQHAAMIALNDLTYSSATNSFDEYKNQYIEKTAKETAGDISFEISYLLENPAELERLAAQNTETQDNELQIAPKLR